MVDAGMVIVLRFRPVIRGLVVAPMVMAILMVFVAVAIVVVTTVLGAQYLLLMSRWQYPAPVQLLLDTRRGAMATVAICLRQAGKAQHDNQGTADQELFHDDSPFFLLATATCYPEKFP